MPDYRSDLILINGKVATLDADNSFREALAVLNGRVVMTGTSDEVRATAGGTTEVIDLAGRTAIPGIIDSHCHPDRYAVRLKAWINVEPGQISSRQEKLRFSLLEAS